MSKIRVFLLLFILITGSGLYYWFGVRTARLTVTVPEEIMFYDTCSFVNDTRMRIIDESGSTIGADVGYGNKKVKIVNALYKDYEIPPIKIDTTSDISVTFGVQDLEKLSDKDLALRINFGLVETDFTIKKHLIERKDNVTWAGFRVETPDSPVDFPYFASFDIQNCQWQPLNTGFFGEIEPGSNIPEKLYRELL